MSTREDAIEAFAEERWPEWYPELHGAGAELRLLERHGRRHSTVHEFELATGGHRARFFVKRPDPTGGRSPDRPYSVPDFPIPDRHRRQGEALEALRRAVETAGPGLAAVKVLGVDDELRVVVIDGAAGRPLRSLLLAGLRWSRGRSPDLGPTFRHTGRLLRVFHSAVASEGPSFVATRGEFLATARHFTDYLAGRTGRRGWFEELTRRLDQLAETHLAAEFELFARFGDFGLTNVLATEDHRVTAIDTLAACRMPALHDLSYLTTGMYLLRPQVASLGLALPRRRLERYEREFLEGYHGESEIPWAAYRTWSVLRALERWSAKTLRHRGGLRSRLIDRYLRTWIEARVKRIPRGS